MLTGKLQNSASNKHLHRIGVYNRKMQQHSLSLTEVDHVGVCDKVVCNYVSKKRARDAPRKSSCCRWIHLILLGALHLIKCSSVTSSVLDKHGNPSSLQRQLQLTPVSSPTKSYIARRINAGGESEYIDTNGISWGADEWYGNIGRRTTPSECNSDIFNTTDDILYCSNRFYPTSIVDPPYRYNIPVPYTAMYEIRLHFAEVVCREKREMCGSKFVFLKFYISISHYSCFVTLLLHLSVIQSC
jgi:hypothetical protein